MKECNFGSSNMSRGIPRPKTLWKIESRIKYEYSRPT